ncbi:hypothetical protein [Paenibacillus popilliae]|uniref:Rhodanese-related sulfurtransferase n=1 Tax=Paenibacillus popilliae ATCC 14706 TaxID=1212764 RepID=M9LPE8_PAEPP|nr:hypothetical protein [Paenibacillus popilliae]GAC42411.1 rhodanese-related sulfurtransferase [Paenibacillus popilliae ATCC 14706]
MRFKNLLSVIFSVALMFMMGQSVNAVAVEVSKDGGVVVDTSSKDDADKKIVLCQGDCKVNVIGKNDKLTVVSKDNKLVVTDVGSKDKKDSFVFTSTDGFKNVSITKNGTLVEDGTKEYKKLVKKYEELIKKYRGKEVKSK